MDSIANANTPEAPVLPMENTLGKVTKLGFFQRRQLKLAAEQKLGRDFIATIASGYSDLGWAGTRRAKEMKKIRELLAHNRMRFSCVSLLALSDETLHLYAYGFERELALKDILPVIEGYREEVRSIQENCPWMGRRRQNELIVRAYKGAVQTMSHFGASAA